MIGAGQKWKIAWQGEATADGMVGTDDGGLIFAQEQSNRVIKIDEKDNVTILLARSHGPGALSVGTNGAIYAVERSCTDPDAVRRAACTEATDIAVLTPDRKVLADKMAEERRGAGTHQRSHRREEWLDLLHRYGRAGDGPVRQSDPH